MRISTPLCFLAAIFTLFGVASAHAADSYKVVHTYPHDQHAFTQGLIYVDGHLYESTGIRAIPPCAKRISKPAASSACNWSPTSTSPKASPTGTTR